MTYRGYKSWRPNSRKDRRARGGARSRTRSRSTVEPASDKTFLVLIGGFFALAILVMLAIVLL